MKIGVCISGFLRTWNQTKDSFKKFFSGVDIDIYAHVYRQNYYEYSAQKNNVIHTDEEIKNMFSGLNVVDIVIEDIEIAREKNRPLSQRYKHIVNYNNEIKESSDEKSNTICIGERIYDQLRVVQLSAELLRRSGKHYDIIIKTRYDVLYLTTPQWAKLLDGKVHFEIGASHGYPSEIVVGGTPTSMKCILDRFSHLEMLFYSKNFDIARKSNCSCKKILPCCQMCSHATFRHLLDYYNIGIGEPICEAIIMRSESLCYIPGLGTVPIERV